jgi:hypothetical protein
MADFKAPRIRDIAIEARVEAQTIRPEHWPTIRQPGCRSGGAGAPKALPEKGTSGHFSGGSGRSTCGCPFRATAPAAWRCWRRWAPVGAWRPCKAQRAAELFSRKAKPLLTIPEHL